MADNVEVGDIVSYYNMRVKRDVHARVIRVWKDFNRRHRAIVTHYDAHTIPNAEVGVYALVVVEKVRDKKSKEHPG